MTNFIRKANRLPIDQIYSSSNWFFVTICTDQRKIMFVEEPLRFHNGKFELNQLGLKIEKTWNSLPTLFSNLIIDQYIIMPNHFHAIIGISGSVFYKDGDRIQTLSDIISKFKSLSWYNSKNDL